MEQNTSWRQTLKNHSDSFLDWLIETNYEYNALDFLANRLSQFLISNIRTEADAREFWDTVPYVLSACNECFTYQLPWVAEAFAFEHFLVRYCRTWSALKHLTSEFVLPLGVQGVRVLDIGTGPAPTLFAISDFYTALKMFAHEAGIQRLFLPSPELNCIEKSHQMNDFVHYFSEYCRTKEPVEVVTNDFANLDFHSHRQEYFNRYQYRDPFTGEEEVDSAEVAAYMSNSLHRYRLIVFSNFFALASTVREYENELRKLFDDLNAGSTVFILGSTDDSYQPIYEELTELAQNSQLRHSEWDNDELGNQIENNLIDRIKSAKHAVYLHLEKLADDPPLPQGDKWPRYNNPDSLPRVSTSFAFRIFRRGNWPRHKSHAQT